MMDQRVIRVMWDHLDSQDLAPRREKRVLWENRVTTDPQASPEIKDSLVPPPKENPAKMYKDRTVRTVMTVMTELREHPVSPEQLEKKVIKVHKVIKVLMVSLAMLVSRDPWVHRDLSKERKEKLETTDQSGYQETMDPKDTKENPTPSRESREKKEEKDKKENSSMKYPLNLRFPMASQTTPLLWKLLPSLKRTKNSSDSTRARKERSVTLERRESPVISLGRMVRMARMVRTV